MYLKRWVTFYQLRLGKCTQEEKASPMCEGRQWKNVGLAQGAAHSQIWLDALGGSCERESCKGAWKASGAGGVH